MKLTIKPKLVITFLLVGLIPFFIIGYISITISGAELEKQAFQKLEAVREIKKNGIESYFDTIRDQVITMSESRMLIEAMKEFIPAFDSFRSQNNISNAELSDYKKQLEGYYRNKFGAEFQKQNQEENAPIDAMLSPLDADSIALQYHYIQANSHPLGEKHLLDRADDKSTYSIIHGRYHPAIRSFLEKFGYYDIFLVHPETGDIVYSVFKELDFTSSLKDGPYSKTNFGIVFKQALGLKKGEFAFIDFKQYLPSYKAPASFIASPIIENGKTLGILIFQMPLDRITSVMSQRAGLGKTGETYLVGSDYLMRSDSFLDTKNRNVVASFKNPGNGKVKTEAVLSAIRDKSGSLKSTNYKGHDVLSAFTTVNILGQKWALIAEISVEEALSAKSSLLWITAMFGIAGSLAISVCGFLIAGSFSSPILGMTHAMKRLSDGKLETEIPSKERSDELGNMADAIQVFKDNMLEVKRLETEHAEAEQKAHEERNRLRIELTKDFDKNIGTIIQSVTSAATEMRASSESLSGTADITKKQAESVSLSSDEASANVQTVAAAAEQLISSIREIGNQVANSSQITRTAVEHAQKTDKEIQELAESASQIGDVVSLITDIAEQTNLLALNATIEAARSGEAGKGFAVVASEVKNLAGQTTNATEQISQQISKIQNATNNAVSTIIKINQTVNQIDTIGSSIAEAVNQQGDATQEISVSVGNAAKGTKEVANNISSVSEAASDTGEAAIQMQGAAGELSQQAEYLRAEVDKFLERSAT